MNHKWLLCGLVFMYNFSIAQTGKTVVKTVASTDGRNHSLNLHAKGLQSIAVDDSDNIYACDVPDNLIIKIYPDGKIENVRFHFPNENFSSKHMINQILFKDGFLYMIDYATNSTIYKISEKGEAVRLAGGISRSLFKDGIGDSAAFYNIRDMAADDKGNLFLTANGIRIISNGFVRTLGKVKGQKPKIYGNDTLPPEIYYEPENITVDDKDNIYVTTFMKGDILKVNLNDSANLYIKANKFYSSDTNSIDAKISGASSLVADKLGDLFVSDVSDGKIKLITPHKNILTIAGSGKHYKYPKDGTAYEASFSNPSQLVLDNSGNIYVSDDGCIRKIILPKNFIQNILSHDAAPIERQLNADRDSLAKSEIDNQTKNWNNVQPFNPHTIFQKQYSGKIGTEDAVFNLTQSPLNIRGQEDLTVWANIGNKLTYFYFPEDELFAKPKTRIEYSVLDSFYIQYPEKFSFENRKYYTGWATAFLAPPQQKLLIRFVNNDNRLEGFLVDNSGAKHPIHFILNTSKPSFPLNYTIAAFHKDTKYSNDSTIKEVPANVSLAIDLPEIHHLN